MKFWMPAAGQFLKRFTVKNKENGKVYLVGAGPGDPGLLTLRGKRLIGQADVIIYDRLASPRLLAFASPDVEFIYVGKRVGRHVANQDEINDYIVKKAREGKTVVRLKGGDPFIFGRGGEEAQIMAEAGIDFEIVPGVTSAIAVPAYAGVPLTHREHTASVAFITGHRRFDTKEAPVQWDGLAKGVGTLVFLMGMTNLAHICEKLIEHGRDPETPVAVIRWGTTPFHRSITGNLSNIAELVKQQGFKPPAIIVIGTVVALRDQLNWFERLPLLGRRILVTRTRAQSSELVRLLERRGAGCVECPAIEVRQPEDLEQLDTAIEKLQTFDWIIFSSPNAVKYFLNRLFEKGNDIRSLGSARIACVGASTADCVREYHLNVDLVPRSFRAEGLVEEFEKLDMKGKNILIPRAKKAREILPQGLEAMGANVTIATTYETVTPELRQDVVEILRDEDVDVLTFTSSSTVKNFFKMVPSDLRDRILSKAKIACICPVTAKTAENQGLTIDIQPEKSTIKDMVDAIEAFFREKVQQA
jgi:uroporphyrinogen III methyltransferase/synthase